MKNILLTLAVLTSLFALPVGLMPNVFAANPLKTACEELTKEQQQKSAACSPDANKDPLTGPDGAINKIANIVAIAAGVAAVIIIIVLGIALVTSAGDAQRVSQARNGIVATVVGLAIIILAKALITFIVNKL